MKISGGKGRPPPTIFGTRKVESLSYRMVKKIVEKFNRLSRVHQRHRQTDRQTDNRQTTDGRLIAYSDREREFTFAKKHSNNNNRKKERKKPYYCTNDNDLHQYVLYFGYSTTYALSSGTLT